MDPLNEKPGKGNMNNTRSEDRDQASPPAQQPAAEKKASKAAAFIKRTLTALPLIVMLILILCNGGIAFAIVAFVMIALSLYEELRALKKGGHHPIRWISYAGLVISVPLMIFYSSVALMPIATLMAFLSVLLVIRREKPELSDILMTMLPMFSIVLPGMCLFGLLDTQPIPLQRMLLTMVFTTAPGGDTAAYLIGSLFGGPKLCPNISPKKTISGALGGLLGSMLLTWAAGAIYAAARPTVLFPPFWANMLVGLVGGVAGQVGDLFASLVKRHCGVKDFSDVLPGHGGVLDRMDSILFTSVIIFCYRAILMIAQAP